MAMEMASPSLRPYSVTEDKPIDLSCTSHSTSL